MPPHVSVMTQSGIGTASANLVAVAFVYLVRCADDSLYCGWTVDLDARVAAHDAGRGARYTRGRGPVTLAAAWETADRSSAMQLEMRIKRLPRAAKERLVAGAGLDGARRLEPS
jgi:predicted GIY-YIG superfamily endonuclease